MESKGISFVKYLLAVYLTGKTQALYSPVPFHSPHQLLFGAGKWAEFVSVLQRRANVILWVHIHSAPKKGRQSLNSFLAVPIDWFCYYLAKNLTSGCLLNDQGEKGYSLSQTTHGKIFGWPSVILRASYGYCQSSFVPIFCTQWPIPDVTKAMALLPQDHLAQELPPPRASSECLEEAG